MENEAQGICLGEMTPKPPLAAASSSCMLTMYWNTKLPNTAMPLAIRNSLPTAAATAWSSSFAKEFQSLNSVIIYRHNATENEFHDNSGVSLFFKPAALHKGNADGMTLRLSTPANGPVFLPRTESEKIPFSSREIPRILDRFSVKPDSDEAREMKKTIKECEEPPVKGEEMQCATSLESMVDFAISMMQGMQGKKIRAVSTETVAGETSFFQNYSVSGVEKMNEEGDGVIVCHKQSYGYAVFHCHKTETTDAFKVSLVGANGAQVKAAAVCHKDTSGWNPNHLAFQVLKVKQGTDEPVCHFLPENHVVWYAKNWETYFPNLTF
ncbi:unnamed protein product [Cuscuta epithymum]|uniref:BURP domain-containing protein n=1 Tax=Cuscuta epithymum TaxID=186058 RepID=A0AAV0D0Y6_9ASTE|nr:unnamed protein product [Cuscuta epithymum]